MCVSPEVTFDKAFEFSTFFTFCLFELDIKGQSRENAVIWHHSQGFLTSDNTRTRSSPSEEDGFPLGPWGKLLPSTRGRCVWGSSSFPRGRGGARPPPQPRLLPRRLSWLVARPCSLNEDGCLVLKALLPKESTRLSASGVALGSVGLVL